MKYFTNILQGDALKVLKTLESGSVHCVVTSLPYYGLRNYGVDGQIGLELSPFEFIEKLVEVFNEVYRVLRTDGTLWLNSGDSFVQEKIGRFRPKETMGMPWRLAFALQDAGWRLRQDIIWNKPNTMPESAGDRSFTSSRNGKDGTLDGEIPVYVTTGWQRTCSKKSKCTTDEVKPCVVLDPFSGAATTGLVSLKHRRNFVGIEISAEYIEMAEERLKTVQPEIC